MAGKRRRRVVSIVSFIQASNKFENNLSQDLNIDVSPKRRSKWPISTQEDVKHH